MARRFLHIGTSDNCPKGYETMDFTMLPEGLSVATPMTFSEILFEDVHQCKIEDFRGYLDILVKALIPGGILRITLLDILSVLQDFTSGVLTVEKTLDLLYTINVQDPTMLKVSDLIMLLNETGCQGIIQETTEDPYYLSILGRPPFSLEASQGRYGRSYPERVIIHTDFNRTFSKGIVGTEVVRTLDYHDVNVCGLQDMICPEISIIQSEVKHLVRFDNTPVQFSDILLRLDHISWLGLLDRPDLHDLYYKKGHRRWGYFFHELTTIPPSWLNRMNIFEEVFFVSRFCAQAAVQSGLNRPVHVFHHGVDLSVFTPRKEPKEEGLYPFTFLIVGRMGVRKGLVELVQAFKQVFGGKGEAKLLIKDIGDYARNLVGPDTEEIQVFQEPMEKNAVAALMQNADCFVLPSYCEGFGLPILEAKACRIPVITTNFGGSLDFCTKKDTFLLDYDLVQRQHEAPPEVVTTWAKPSVEHLEWLLQKVYNEKDLRNAVAQAGYNQAITMSWDNVLRPLMKVIRGV